MIQGGDYYMPINSEDAVQNIVDKIAGADTVEEAIQWQSILSNLTSSLNTLEIAQQHADEEHPPIEESPPEE